MGYIKKGMVGSLFLLEHLAKQSQIKSSVIQKEECTDSEGNKGSWVLYSSDGKKKLGCHASRESAEEQERAIQARKHQ